MDVHGLLSLVYHVEEGLEHVLEARGPKHVEAHYVSGKAGLGFEVERPPRGRAEARQVVGIQGVSGEESVVEELVHDLAGPAEPVLHGVQDVGLLPVILQQGVDAVAIHPEVERGALVQELLQLGRAEWGTVSGSSLEPPVSCTCLPLGWVGSAPCCTPVSSQSHSVQALDRTPTGPAPWPLNCQARALPVYPSQQRTV